MAILGGAMADRAYREDDPNKGVFDLENDERWQERLAEARKRREIALKKKAGLGHNQPKPKPWEIEESRDEPKIVVQPPSEGDKQRDFSDRFNSIREGSKPKKPVAEKEPPSEQEVARKSSVDEYLPPAPEMPGWLGLRLGRLESGPVISNVIPPNSTVQNGLRHGS